MTIIQGERDAVIRARGDMVSIMGPFIADIKGGTSEQDKACVAYTHTLAVSALAGLIGCMKCANFKHIDGMVDALVQEAYEKATDDYRKFGG